MPGVEKIISGGQTGADRAALDTAIRLNIPHGGYCPKGRVAEDGRIDARYLLEETESVDYRERTELNVIHSDGTAVFTVSGILDGGTKETADFAKKHNKPLLRLKAVDESPVSELAYFIGKYEIKVLNVAGPRASREPGVGAFVDRVLSEALAEA
ncbi:MAG: putative molybdenum carrier protein [Fibrobacterota bacterium]